MFVSGCEDNLPLFPGGSFLSPGYLAHFGRQLVAEVESRRMQSIETGLLYFVFRTLCNCFALIVGWLFSRLCLSVSWGFLVWFIGFSQPSEKIGDQRRTRTYGSHKHLHKRPLSLHPVYADFVSGDKCGKPNFFFCRVCHRDVRMKAHGAGEFKRHFSSDRHWYRNVNYRLHMGLSL